tara:strand:- start:54968 stop:55246 length:279 start_codon:yes stop_codon:yes gene_type:complete
MYISDQEKKIILRDLSNIPKFRKLYTSQDPTSLAMRKLNRSSLELISKKHVAMALGISFSNFYAKIKQPQMKILFANQLKKLIKDKINEINA